MSTRPRILCMVPWLPEAGKGILAEVADVDIVGRDRAASLESIPRYDRPWARAPESSDEITTSPRPGTVPRPPRDATPHADDLEAGD